MKRFSNLRRLAGDAQHVRHGAPTRNQDRADQQKLGMAPGAMDEQRRERQVDPGEAAGKDGMAVSLGGDATSLFTTPASSPQLNQHAGNGQSRAYTNPH
ncbi:hypothetical protein [Methylobacterium sp. J-070]|uniref:hypothetical protein n=1 Tax=Methylobacterium sp. J-070 TaxID=2836650 RepID=UPI001FBBB667|nr:hypothetical protein [Methylobacterium sp. J-070]MCJ2048459.1 hypothetical protein [Methylobacterium sp. J-070]